MDAYTREVQYQTRKHERLARTEGPFDRFVRHLRQSKPHLEKLTPASWMCSGQDQRGFGITAADAYAHWRHEVLQAQRNLPIQRYGWWPI